MSILTVPAYDGAEYPTLGPLVVEWMHRNLVFGPGDLLGDPLVLSVEQQGFIYRFYELFPQAHPEAGRRRFKRCALSIAKGLAKTELAAFVAIAELASDAPVRFAGWDDDGEPLGRPVTDPMVIMCAFSEQQSDELCFGAMRRIIQESRIEPQFRVGIAKVQRRVGNGTAVSVASSPSARDGARTTFCIQDETHHWTSQRLKKAHQVLIANLPKRPKSDPWSLEVTTAPEPGLKSVAEETMDFARAIHDGKVREPRLFYFHREASDEHDLDTEEGARAAAIEASGKEAAKWRDIDGVVAMWSDPTTDRRWWERVWCNKLVRSSMQAFDAKLFKELAVEESPVKEGDLITLGFDGAIFVDATAIVATHVETGYQWTVGVWEQPFGHYDWRVPEEEVDDAVEDMFARFDVWRMYGDPPYWQSWIANWKSKFGDKTVIEWWTNRRQQMTRALENYDTAIKTSILTHDGDSRLIQHVGNAFRHDIALRDQDGRLQWLIRKERPDSPRKIDCAMASVLSWEARTDCIASGVSKIEEFFIL